MEQQPQKKAADAPAPPTPAAQENDSGASGEPEQAIRPEDEAVVVERLRELGYIE